MPHDCLHIGIGIGPSLLPFHCVRLRALGGVFRNSDPLQAHIQPGMVHHREHILDTPMWLSNKMADRALVFTEDQCAGWARVNPKFVFD